MTRVIPLLVLVACGPKLPVSPPLPDAPLQIDREALPGGSLRAYHSATVAMVMRQAVHKGSKEATRAPVSIYLFEHPTEGWVIIDAGFGTSSAGDAPSFPLGLFAKLLDIQDVAPMVDRLGDVDIEPGDITQAFITHLHIDHVGMLGDLPDAVIRVPEDEWNAAQKKRMLAGYDPEPYLGNRYEPLVFDDGPFGAFSTSDDVFGDGSLIALPAPGHTKGHTMFMVNLPEGSWLLTGDAAWVDANWEQGPRPKGHLPRTLVEDSWKLGVSSLWRIGWFSRQPGVTVISGHEPENLTRLPAWPHSMN